MFYLGNVLFSSAIHGYAFSVEDFADLYTEKLKLDKKVLQEGLFGDFYLQAGGIKVCLSYIIAILSDLGRSFIERQTDAV